jgi:predicted ATP-binding protein involved in virulence
MRISKITVRQLFGLPTYNYDIELKLDKRITIIHGPNGSGKTVIFKLLDGLFNGQYMVFWRYPFTEFTVDFDNGRSVHVVRDAAGNYEVPDMPVIRSSMPEDAEFPLGLERGIVVTHTGRPTPSRGLRIATGPVEVNGTEWVRPESFAGPALLRLEPEWLSQIRQQCRVHFIRADRLTSTREELDDAYQIPHVTTVPTIVEYSDDLKSQIQNVIVAADQRAKEIDRTFPIRLISRATNQEKVTPSLKELEQQQRQLLDNLQQLVDVGLIEGIETETGSIPDSLELTEELTIRRVLGLYIEDTKDKLKAYATLAMKLDLFRQIAQGMLQSKDLRITSKAGISVISESGAEIPLAELSSGEQHILVLVYNLLFLPQEEQDRLILIDEPELSMHIAWQKRFVTDLSDIVELSPFDAIIATHSPAIINGKLDLLVGLRGTTAEESR